VRRAAFLSVAVLVTLAGCGEKQLDTGDAEGKIKTELANDLGSSIASVSCPEDVEAAKGVTFTCAIKGGDGTTYDLKVDQTDADGHFRFNAPLLQSGRIEREIAAAVEQQTGQDAKVRCPDLYAAKAGSELTCAVETGGKTVDARLTVDDKGTVNFEVPPT